MAHYSETSGLRGNAFIVYEALSVILKNPIMDERAKGNAVINLYIVVKGIYFEDKRFQDHFKELDVIAENLHDTYENFVGLSGGIEPQKVFWKHTNRMFFTVWDVIVQSGIIKEAAQRNYVVPDE